MKYRLKQDLDVVLHPRDCERICEALKRFWGIDASLIEAARIWSEHSAGLAAGWLTLPLDPLVIRDVLARYIEEEAW